METREMNEIMKKAEVLIEALPYIQKFNRKIIVVKYGGSAMVDEKLKRQVIQDVTLLKLVGFKPVIVHGGGKEISKWVKLSGKEPEFKEGDVFRITVPLDDEYSYDFGNNNKKNADKMPIILENISLTKQQSIILEYVKKYGKITSSITEGLLEVKQRRAREILKELADKNILLKQGSYKNTAYVLNIKNE